MRHHTVRLATLAASFAVACISGGCLVKETSATICLDADGSGRWTLLERNIHATGDTPADRQREETAFMDEVATNQHPGAVAFRTLGGSGVRSEVVSPHWPYAVLTEASFPNIGRVCQQILDSMAGVHGQSRLERKGNRTTWTITIDYDADAEASNADTGADSDVALLGDDGPVLFMRHGQFVEAVGFDIADDGRVAKMKDLDDHDWNKDPHLVLSLTWVDSEAVNAPRTSGK